METKDPNVISSRFAIISTILLFFLQQPASICRSNSARCHPRRDLLEIQRWSGFNLCACCSWICLFNFWRFCDSPLPGAVAWAFQVWFLLSHRLRQSWRLPGRDIYIYIRIWGSDKGFTKNLSGELEFSTKTSVKIANFSSIGVRF